MAKSSLWLQTVTLVKRNLLTKIRLKSSTIQEILMPIYFVVLLAILKTFAYKPTAYSPLTSVTTTPVTSIYYLQNATFYVAPDFPEAQSAMSSLQNLGLFSTMKYKFFDSQTEMDNEYKNIDEGTRASVYGIYFPTSSVNEYALRFKYNSIPSDFTDDNLGNCRQGNGTDRYGCPANQYLFQGFGKLQAAFDTAIMRGVNSTISPLDISARIMPKDATLANIEVFSVIAPIYMVWALTPFMTFLLAYIVYEKEKRIKEGMKMMGMQDLAFWLSYATVYTTLILIMTLVMTIIGVFGNLFTHSNFFLIFLLNFLYGISVEMMAFMITPFFSKARSAAGLGSILTLIMALLFLLVGLNPDFPEWGVWLISLLSPVAYAFTMNKVFYFEVVGTGAHFNNIADGPNPLYIGLVMIIVDIFLYFLLTLYLDSVIPGEYGRRRSPFFCLKPSFWCKGRNRGISRGRSTSTRSVMSNGSHTVSQDDIEPIAQEFVGQEAIRLQNITKVFRKIPLFNDTVEEVTAVKNFSLDIYKGQITALLGHNGAGKSTIFNILTGFIPSTSGSTNVYDYDVSDADDMDEIRAMTGVCPQHDILLDHLSVKEHLEVFAGLKGIRGDEKDAEVERVIKIVGLEDQRDTFSKKLSGGQKRKLSVGIAITGDPKILILDEPTAGMDPYSRRKLWDLLRAGQQDRVTLLTTHFMDEADLLADRKAIINKGRLRCAGSSLFLKNRFGVGYHLGIVTKNHDDATGVTSCVLQHINDAEIERSVGLEHVYTLPLAQVSNFSVLFSTLETRQSELNIQSYGVSMTTMEEVFLKIGEEDEEDSNDTPEANGKIDGEPVNDSVVLNVNEVETMFDPSRSETSAEPRNSEVILALVKHSFLINIRNPGYILFSFFFPIGLIVGGVYMLTTSDAVVKDINNPPMVDVTYKNNFDLYKQRSVLYKNSSGSSLFNFINNVQPGIPIENADLDNAAVMLQSGFYPHAVGLDVRSFDANASYTAVYNTSYIRSLPSAINFFSNALATYLNGSASNIVTYTKDWPKTDSTKPFNGGVFGGVILCAMAIVLSTSFAASYPVRERQEKIRAQLRVSGVKFQNYWFSWLIIDYSMYFTMSLVFVITLLGFQVDPLIIGGAMGALILLLIGWGFSCILSSYCGSFLFDKFETAQSTWPMVVQLMSILPYIIVTMLDLAGNLSDVAMALNVVFVVLIPYYVGFSGIYYILKVYLDFYIKAAISGTALDIPNSVYFDWSNPMVPVSILMAYLHIIILSVILVIADVKKNGGQLPSFRKNHRTISNLEVCHENPDIIQGEDDDVMQERRKVQQLEGNHGNPEQEAPIVVMDSVRKEFVKRTDKKCSCCRRRDPDEDVETTKVAVRNLSLTVYPGEVMGLLGPNGAGKTTALNTLIADIAPTTGGVSVAGHPVTSIMSDAFKVMGYCPQSNPLWDTLSLREHLEIYAAVRGVAKDKIAATVDNFIDGLDIREHEKKRAITLSGGTKRKLCFAISMLGNPQVVLLDEPSTGMDPKTKRFMWNTISRAFEGSSRGAILTTHYMEEADALCSRVGIMVLGHLKCIGSTQHLKDKFGQGYILEVKVEDQQVDENQDDRDEDAADNFSQLHDFVKELFPTVDQPEKIGTRATYKIKKGDVKSLADVFSSLEEAKARLGIEEYSFSQSTLEQVFLRFAKEQAEKDELEQQQIAERKRERKERKKRK